MKKKITIVGAGITGLMTGLKLHKEYDVTMIDAGPDPREDKHLYGATYSGMNARHVSYTETAPWTSSARHTLIETPSRDGGWLSIPKQKLYDNEKQWITEFQNIALNESIHKSNTTQVIESNKKGFALWKELSNTCEFIKPVVNTTVMPILCRTKNDLLEEFEYEHSLDSVCKLYEGQSLQKELSSLQPHLDSLGNLGYFTLRGLAYYSRDICIEIIRYLESQGVSFIWNHLVSDLNSMHPTDYIVWCSGISKQTADILSAFSISFGGVIGCWVEIENPGIILPFKIYGPEPVNYINITPHDSALLMSGGYGFVGTHPYDEAVEYARPIMRQMIAEVNKWFPDCKILNKAYCIRPATPTGVPTLVTHYLKDKTPIIVAVGHSAGGFTQAPYTAELIWDELKKLKKLV